MEQRTCANPQCGGKFIPRRRTQKFCCSVCRLETYKGKYPYKPVDKTMICKCCKRPFKTSKRSKKYCSKKCSDAMQYTKAVPQKRICPECGEPFTTTHAHKRYCDEVCRKAAAHRRYHDNLARNAF